MKKIKVFFGKNNIMWIKNGKGTFEKISKQKHKLMTFFVSKPDPSNMCE